MVQERNADGTFKRKFHSPWDGSVWDEGFLGNRGYFYVYRPDHPKANHMGMVRRHHVVWWIVTGEVIESPYALHHINGIKNDDLPNNLEKVEHGEHTRIHWTGKTREGQNDHLKNGSYFVCLVCGELFYRHQWIINHNKSKHNFCSKGCYRSRKGVINVRK